ncbi:hypothetical protein [Endozoicomonas atrinae]|uniref:hypothetical protein n=1 Tax=Endozoicomonas atrinae TaxID=1333660 RepID=UPI001EE76A65|nr:hypothetical protein [Endozoicomonas atrinae]
MYRFIVVFMASLLFSHGVSAEKPEWAGKGKPTAEQKAAHKALMNAKETDEETEKLLKEPKQKKEKEVKQEKPVKGLEKQKDKKSAQGKKELGKGSETGQEASSSKRKWWKFWE